MMELQEISVEDRKQKLENSTREQQSLETAVETNKARLEGKSVVTMICLGGLVIKEW